MPTESLLHGLLLAAQSGVVAAILLLLVHLRRVWGLLPLACFVGCVQYLQTILASTLYVPIPPGLSVSPGSVALFPSGLAAVLAVYLLEGVVVARSLILGILLANVSLTVLSSLALVQMDLPGAVNLLGIPAELFAVEPRIFVVGTGILFLDVVLIVLAYEQLGTHARGLPLGARIPVALFVVLGFDAVAFPALALAGAPDLGRIVVSHVLGKAGAALVYGAALTLYLARVRDEDAARSPATRYGPMALLTYRERLEEARLEQERREAEFLRVEAAKNEMLATVTHELRTPVTSIRGSLHLLDRPELPEDSRREMLEIARRNVERLRGLIDELLDFERLQAGRETLQLEPRRLEPLVREAVEEVRGLGTERAVRIGLRVEAEPGIGAAVDPDRLRQVVVNLCSNAIKFSPDGAEVEVCLRREGDRVRVEVADRGPGVPEEDRERIWQRFARVSGRQEKQVGGSGLGLAISRTLIRAMRGREGSRDRAGGGSVFWVELEAMDDVQPRGGTGGAGRVVAGRSLR